jgi:hypothetical protein
MKYPNGSFCWSVYRHVNSRKKNLTFAYVFPAVLHFVVFVSRLDVCPCSLICKVNGMVDSEMLILPKETVTRSQFADVIVFSRVYKLPCRSQWPGGMNRKPSSPARTLGSRVRIPLKSWMSVGVYSVCAVLCVGSGLATGWSPVQGVLLTVYRLREWKKRPRSTRAVKP